MLLSPSMIHTLIANVQLAVRDEAHFNHLMNGLCSTIDEQHLHQRFDSFAFVWGLLPQWARVMLLSIAYRECKNTLAGVTPLTPISDLTEPQRRILSLACEKLLTAVVTLFADYQFSEDFYNGWLESRRQPPHSPKEHAA